MTQMTQLSRKGEIVSLPLALLNEDDTIYPRQGGMDTDNINRLVEALQAGAAFPRPVVDRDSKKIVDGWHRIEAHRRVYGKTATIQVELRQYADKAEMFQDAVRLNNAHGLGLSTQDRVRCVAMADLMGISTGELSMILTLSELKVEKLRTRLAVASLSTPGVLPVPTRTLPVGAEVPPSPVIGLMPLKRSLLHLSGTTLTMAQAEGVKSAPGVDYRLLAFQLRDGIQRKLVNVEDKTFQEELRQLYDALIAYFS